MSFFSIWSHKKKNLLFTVWIMFWDISRIYFFFFNIQNIKSNSVSHIYIIFLKFFPIIFFWWKIYSFPVIFQFLLFFAYLCWVLHDLTQALQRIENILLSFLLMRFIAAFLFLSNQENLYLIHQNSGLFYDISNTRNEHDQIHTSSFSLIPNYFDIYF